MQIFVPSYITPGTYCENVVFADRFQALDGIELLFFFFDAETEALFEAEQEQILTFRQRFRFHVHMPDLVKPEHERILALTRHLADRYVLHPPADDQNQFIDTISNWIAKYGNIFYLENLIGRDFMPVANALPELPLCFDIGHLLLNGGSPARFAETHGTRIKELHFHGVSDSRDHQPINGDEPWFLDLLPFLRSFEGVLNIELFDHRQVSQVLSVLETHGLARIQD